MIGSQLSSVEQHLANKFGPETAQHERFAGIIGERPSQSAKSPVLWNAAFKGLGLNAIFLPFDVDESKLPALVHALRTCESLVGFSVTVPYKIKILPLLDELDDKAAHIGAVNAVARGLDGRLVGYNTDGSGFLASLTLPVVDAPLFDGGLAGVDVLLIGAGGAGRAVAFYLAEQIAPARLFITHRTPATASELAAAVNKAYGNAEVVDEQEIETRAANVGLIVNSSTKGQFGARKIASGKLATLEPYSALAPANPAGVDESVGLETGIARHRWFEASMADIVQNNRASLAIAARVPVSTPAYDLIFAPVETVFLRHLRYSGHRVANGKGMNIAQAVDGFCDRVCADYLRERGFSPKDARQRVVQEMSRVW